MKRNTALLCLVIGHFLYGLSLLYTSNALEAVGGDMFRMLVFRFGIVVLCLNLLRLVGVIKISYKGKDVRPLLLAGAMLPVLYFIMESLGVMVAPSSQVGVMLAAIPVVTTLMGFLFLREKPRALQILFMLVSVGGVVFINLAGGRLEGNLIGFLYMCGTVVSASAYTILIRRFGPGYNNFEITYLLSTIGFVVFLAISLTQHAVGGTLGSYLGGVFTLSFLGPVSFLSIGCSLVAFTLIAAGVKRVPVVVSTSITCLTTVVAVLAGILFLGERFSPADIVGSVLVLGGALAISLVKREGAHSKKNKGSVQ